MNAWISGTANQCLSLSPLPSSLSKIKKNKLKLLTKEETPFSDSHEGLWSPRLIGCGIVWGHSTFSRPSETGQWQVGVFSLGTLSLRYGNKVGREAQNVRDSLLFPVSYSCQPSHWKQLKVKQNKTIFKSSQKYPKTSWPEWLSWLKRHPVTEGLQVRFLVRHIPRLWAPSPARRLHSLVWVPTGVNQ